MLPGGLVVVCEGDIGDFKAFGDDGVDDHGLFGAGLGDADGDFVHVAVVGVFFLLLLVLLVLLVLVEVGGGLDIGQQAHGVLASGSGEFHQGVFSGDGPPVVLEVFLESGHVSEVALLGFDLALDDGGEGGGCLLDFASETVCWLGDYGYSRGG